MEYASGEDMESDDDRPPPGPHRPAEGAIKYGEAQLGSHIQAGTAAGNIHMQQDDAETLELEMASCCVTKACPAQQVFLSETAAYLPGHDNACPATERSPASLQLDLLYHLQLRFP